MRIKVSWESRRSSGISFQSHGNDTQCPGHRGESAGRNRSGSTVGSLEAELSSANEENGTLRPSRSARVLAQLVRMQKIQVLSEDRPSKRSSPCRTPNQ